MGRVTVAGGKPAMGAPVGQIALGSIAQGSLVKLNENGSPVEFYVAKHNFASGKTLLVRKTACDINKKWSNSGGTVYADSDIDKWLTGTYVTYLDSAVQAALASLSVQYRYNASTTKTISRKVFILSHTELGISISNCTALGSTLPTASVLRTNASGWLRTVNNSGNVFWHIGGTSTGGGDSDNQNDARPCFAIPATARFNGDTLVLEEV